MIPAEKDDSRRRNGMDKKMYNAGDVIIREGDIGNHMYEIVSGTVDVYTGYQTGNEKKLGSLGPGRIFGEMALLEYYPRSATVVCTSDGAEMTEISDSELETFIKSEPAQVRTILTSLSHRLRELTADYSEVCGTIKEMKETDVAQLDRGLGLLEKIAKFLNLSKTAEEKGFNKQKSVQPAADQTGFSGSGLVEKRWKQGEVIFREGDAADCMYYLGYGNVDIYTGYKTENEKLLTSLTENKFFGEMGLIEKEPRSATAVAASDVVLADQITEDDLESLTKTSPLMTLLLLQHLSSRLRNLTGDYLGACRTVQEMAEAEEEGRGLSREQLEKIEMYSQISLMNSYTQLI